MTCSRPDEPRLGGISGILQRMEEARDRRALPVEEETPRITDPGKYLMGQIMILQALGFAVLAAHAWKDRETLSAMLSAIGIGSGFQTHQMLVSATVMSGILAWVLLHLSTRTKPAKKEDPEHTAEEP